MNKSFGQRIEELRNENDFSMRELAAKVGISAPFVSTPRERASSRHVFTASMMLSVPPEVRLPRAFRHLLRALRNILIDTGRARVSYGSPRDKVPITRPVRVRFGEMVRSVLPDKRASLGSIYPVPQR